MKIKPCKILQGKITLPGDKSISHRAALIAALAASGSVSRLENFATNADCASTLNCLENLGVEIHRENSTVFIKGVGKTGFQKPGAALDCGNSGTTMRLLAGILAGQPFESVLTGDQSLQKRPMQRIIEPLRKMGARIEAASNECAPLKISGRNPLKPISYNMPIASAQVKSCVLLAGLNADGNSQVRNPESETAIPGSRNHTELMLEYFGAEIEEEFIESANGFAHQVSVNGRGSELSPKNLQIPADISSAAFFIVGAACLKNSEILIENVGLNPTRTGIINALTRLGAEIEILGQRKIGNELIGDLLVRGGEFAVSAEGKNVFTGDIIPNLIDEIPILAVFGTQIENGLEIRRASELRVKETDRITAIVENLRRMNADVEEFSDGFRVKKSKLKGAHLDSFGDHRIAMAFSVAALLADGETEITGAEASANVSFPEFFDTLKSVCK